MALESGNRRGGAVEVQNCRRGAAVERKMRVFIGVKSNTKLDPFYYTFDKFGPKSANPEKWLPPWNRRGAAVEKQGGRGAIDNKTALFLS